MSRVPAASPFAHSTGLGVPRRAALIATLSCPWSPALAAAKAKAPPSSQPQPPALLLAQDAPPDIDPAGWLVSEKLDGVRGHWDGATLRLRSGLPVASPAAWLAQLPAGVALDGELWAGRGRFDAVSAAVRSAAAPPEVWARIGFHVFELPGAAGPFSARAERLATLAAQVDTGASPLRAAPQRTVASRAQLAQWLAEVEAAGGEGLMLHRADAEYVTGRSPALRKLKPLHDAEAQVVAHRAGQGKYAGLMGALVLRTPQGRVFALGSGFTDAQRRQPPAVGSWVTYRYRGLTATGIPRFATFWRRHDPALA